MLDTPDYYTITLCEDVPENQVRCFELYGHFIAVCKVNGEFFAVENKCSHAESTFDDARLRGYRLLCPLHGAVFDVRTGGVVSAPAIHPIKTYPVRVVGNEIQVCLNK